jgi:hypothetical protein
MRARPRFTPDDAIALTGPFPWRGARPTQRGDNDGASGVFMPLFNSSTELDKGTCRLICPIAAAMVGVCLTGIGILQLVISVDRHSTLADDILSVDALLFLIALLSAYFALRLNSKTRLHRLEQVADISFIAAMVLMTIACFVITYALNLQL